MNLKNAFLRGTLLLTITGIISRIMGFFYRIFLANTIGAEGMGIYQLIFPIYAVCFSLCASGIETSVSKLTAEKTALGKHQDALNILKTALFLTGILSICCSLFIYFQADFLAAYFLKDPRCEELLKILAITIPFGTIQSCICGYYFGVHKAGIPAFAQLIEQGIRMLSVCFLYHLFITNQIPVSPKIAVIGLVIGELCSLLVTLTCFSFQFKPNTPRQHCSNYTHFKEILTLAIPLTISRICINLLASLEATMIPNALKAYGMDTSTALSIYGVLTGMALPFILFPNALTSSISLMLLPRVSESQAKGQIDTLKNTIRKTFSFCIFLGCGCLLFFLIFGNYLGSLVFSSELAGKFITILAWLCPFLYLNTTLNSILNGLGLTNLTFTNGILSIFLRIGFVFWGIPVWGIQGYLFGLLASQLFSTVLSCFFLYRVFHFKNLKC